MEILGKNNLLMQVTDEMITEDLAVIDEIISEDIDTLSILVNPEKLIGKPYEQWNERDFQLLSQIYGNDPKNKLNKLIFDREYTKFLAGKEV